MNRQELEKYALKYLDNGGKYEDIPDRNKQIKNEVRIIQKRRFMIYIRYGMLKNNKFSQEVLELIKENKHILDTPVELYASIDKLSFEKIKNLQKRTLHSSKREK